MKMYRDIQDPKHMFNKQHMGRTADDVLQSIALLRGTGYASVGKLSHFLIDMHNNVQHPRGAIEWQRGLLTGKVDKRGPWDTVMKYGAVPFGGARKPRAIQRQ
jgi:hypothetical protein